jgi:hypothetical protein
VTTPLDPAALRITRGKVTPEEIAALVVVFNAVLSASDNAARKRALGVEWNAPHRGIRKTLPHGAGAWRRSALPH